MNCKCCKHQLLFDNGTGDICMLCDKSSHPKGCCKEEEE